MSVYRPTYRTNDGTKKQQRVWWTDFIVNHRLIRESTGQRTKALAQRYERRRRAELDGTLMVCPGDLAGRKFAERYWAVRGLNPLEIGYAPIEGMCTYVVYHPGTGHIKIGKSAQPRSRLTSLQVAASSELILLDLLRGDCELDLHAELQAHRVRGEWFAPEIHELFRAVEGVAACITAVATSGPSS